MTSTLYFLKYNNYYNRTVKREERAGDYENYLIRQYERINFNQNDEIDTTQLINYSDVQILPDYVVVTNDNEDYIRSRWFVMNSERTRSGQYKFTLHRDLLADNYDMICSTKGYYERGLVSPESKLIFNSEDGVYNQIKMSETPIKDKSGCAWLVGYYSKTCTGENKISGTATTLEDTYQDVGDIENWRFNYYRTHYCKGHTCGGTLHKFHLDKMINSHPMQFSNIKYSVCPANNYSKSETTGTTPQGNAPIYPVMLTVLDSNWALETLAPLDEQLTELNMSNAFYPDNNDYDDLINLDGKTIKYTSGDVEHNGVIKVKKSKYKDTFMCSTSSEAYQILYNKVCDSCVDESSPDSVQHNIEYEVTLSYERATIELVEDSCSLYNYSIEDNKYTTIDAPYDVFAIPYPTEGDYITIKNTGNSIPDCSMTRSVAIAVATAIGQKYSGSGGVYDIQLLPYCPVRNVITSDGEIDLMNKTKLYNTIKIDSTSTVVGYILNVSRTIFTFDIPLENPIEVGDAKIESECDMYRLCSPNYNGLFEFNSAKNGGIHYFNVDCMYQPYQPYIHINPDFGGLYNKDFNDSRGLVLSGDFSIPLINDKWETYQLQNKNFENSFNRQIQNMEFNNKWERREAVVGAISGAIGGGVSSAGMGAVVGGLPGAVIGGAVGGVSSGIAGGLDVARTYATQEENMDYTKTLHKCEIGNIQALPQSVSKTNPFNGNNKVYPFLEYYTCTEEEKQRLKDRLKYEGMSYMAYGNISDMTHLALPEYFYSNKFFVKGSIEVIGVDGTYNYVSRIVAELQKGVYIEI